MQSNDELMKHTMQNLWPCLRHCIGSLFCNLNVCSVMLQLTACGPTGAHPMCAVVPGIPVLLSDADCVMLQKHFSCLPIGKGLQRPQCLLSVQASQPDVLKPAGAHDAAEGGHSQLCAPWHHCNQCSP